MKRWQLTLMTVVLLTPALVLFMGVSALLWVPILWFLGRKVINSLAGEQALAVRVLKAAVRLIVATFTAFGYLAVVREADVFPRILSLLPGADPVLFIALFCLLIYWLQDTYALVPCEGARLIILRTVITLILGSFAFIGFGFTFALLYFRLAHPVEGPINFGWTAWGLLSLSLVLPFYATWKLLPQNHRRLYDFSVQ